MRPLTIRLLGTFQVRRQGELIPSGAWPTQKCKTVLKILLTERGRVVLKERLVELVWPDLAPESATSSLHVAVSQLRRTLEPDLERPGQSRFVLTRSGGYLFQAGEDCWVDADAFWEAVSRGQHWAQQEAWGPAVASFRTAEDLYHGDFLQEDAFEEWAIGPRERLREAYLDCLSELARCCARLGEVGEAVAACEKVLARDSLRESVYRQLMTYHYRQGNRDQALRAYERCRTALADTLGVAPMSQTRELHTRIVQDRPVVEPARPSSQVTQPAARQEKGPGGPGTLPIVGRDDELEALDKRLAQALAGRGQTVFITGEAGAGKTRLAEALLERARSRGVQVWRGKCHEVERDLPFQPLREALRPYLLRRLTPEQARHLLGPWARQVAVLVPEIKEILPDLAQPDPLPPEEARRRLLDDLSQFCLSLAGRYPLLLFLDDVQWAAPSTVQFLHRFARNLGEDPILLLVAFRAEEVADTHPLTSMERSLRRKGLATRLALGSLSPAAVASLVERKAAPGWDSAPFSRRLFAETEGNALFLNELLQSLLEEGHLVEDDAGRWRPAPGTDLKDITLRLPETVQTVIQARCRGASDAAQDVLGAAAVIGRSFDVTLLEHAGEAGTATLLDALDELLARRLIHEPDEAANGEYLFGHDKIREVVYAGLSRARRRHLHGQIAAGLEALTDEGAEAPAGRLARHYAEAGRDHKALHYAILAGDRAAAQYAHTEALTHYNRALEIAERVEPTPDQLVHLYTKRGRVLELDAQYGEALANYQEMEATARERGDRSAELTAVMARVTVHATALFDEARAEELAERAMALARDVDDRAAEAKLLWNLSLLYRSTNRLPEAVECGERSLALSRELGLREQAAFALHDLGGAYTALGRLAKAVAALEEAGELWHELDNVPMLGDSVAGLSGLFAFAGDFERALAAAEQAFEIGASIDNVWVKVTSKGAHISLVYWEMGRPDKALSAAEECFRLTKEAEIDTFGFQRAFRGFVYGRLGAVERGLAILHRELKVAETQLRLAPPVVRCMLARLHLQNDNLTEAEAALNQSKESGDNDYLVAFFATWLGLAEAELALRQGNVERALALTSDFLAELRDRGAGAYIPHFLTMRGRALLAAGRIEAAGNTLEKARAAAEEMGSRQRLWQILTALAEVETARGNREQGDRLRRQARQILREIAGRVPTAELRTSFLARSDVRALLKKG